MLDSKDFTHKEAITRNNPIRMKLNCCGTKVLNYLLMIDYLLNVLFHFIIEKKMSNHNIIYLCELYQFPNTA